MVEMVTESIEQLVEQERQTALEECLDEIEEIKQDLEFRKTKEYARFKEVTKRLEEVEEALDWFTGMVRDTDLSLIYRHFDTYGGSSGYTAGSLLREVLKDLKIRGLTEADKREIAEEVAEKIIEKSQRSGWYRKAFKEFNQLDKEIRKIEENHPYFVEYLTPRELEKELSKLKGEVKFILSDSWARQKKKEIEQEQEGLISEEMQRKAYYKKIERLGGIRGIVNKVLRHPEIKRLINNPESFN